ncbi:hypothetical protein PN498_18930 [Oscillatoria sp. CS-180]|uniref:hypothetical protein n=1 Tax=Oscillatoria sp. CS-180 TaxID=3021720 RepID=UPI00232D4D1F|nr:hypothetical protein [Oscillatoria sp. CS-180]MDB9528077.1 hypothetical protein [Oscillatoria sp. CS-180]
MLLAQFATALAAIPLLMPGPSAVEIAQNTDPYANWIYLYQDVFQNSAGQEVTQQWWLEPDVQRSNLLNFTLLARRSPVSDNGTAAAVFDYVADCEAMSYSIERTEFLDGNNTTLDVQTSQKVMESANPESQFYTVLNDICNGIY